MNNYSSQEESEHGGYHLRHRVYTRKICGTKGLSSCLPRDTRVWSQAWVPSLPPGAIVDESWYLSWEESTKSGAHSIPRPAHASVMFITLGMFQKHLSIKQKTRQFNCLMGLCDFPKKKTQEQRLLCKCIPDATEARQQSTSRYKLLNDQKLSVAWTTDSA